MKMRHKTNHRFTDRSTDPQQRHDNHHNKRFPQRGRSVIPYVFRMRQLRGSVTNGERMASPPAITPASHLIPWRFRRQYCPHGSDAPKRPTDPILSRLPAMTITEKMCRLYGLYKSAPKPTISFTGLHLPVHHSPHVLSSQGCLSDDRNPETNGFDAMFDANSSPDLFVSNSEGFGDFSDEESIEMNESIVFNDDFNRRNSFELKESDCNAKTFEEQFEDQLTRVFDNAMESYSSEGRMWSQSVHPLRSTVFTDARNQIREFLVNTGWLRSLWDQLMATLRKHDYTLDGSDWDLSLLSLNAAPVEDLQKNPKARRIDLSNNFLSKLPDSFTALNHLIVLDLSRNQLTSLPQSFGDLNKLIRLDLYSNQLRTLPLSFGRLSRLKWLDLKSNPLEPRLAKYAGDCVNARQCELCAINCIRF
ncbi:unnamed protein product, partial [Oppiella nova]